MEQIDLFRQDLEGLGITPVINNDELCLEYQFDAVDQKAVSKLFNKYVGFWKSIGIAHDHSKDERIARYRIPVKWITGEDITDDQLMTIAGNISKKIVVPPSKIED